jgi:putative DNA primase/helicase
MKLKHNIALDIATANSAHAAKWKNKRTTWEEVAETLSQTERTSETVKQYFSYTKDKQDEIKDVGGFVGGKLLPGTNKIKGQDVTFKAPYGWRRKGFVGHRQLVALDVDFGTLDVWLDFGLLEYAGLFYTTHKHTPEVPRFRIVFPLDRPVTPDEYECIARVVASWLDIEMFDDTTYQPTRLMYYPSTSKDGEFLTNLIDGPIMVADDILAELDDWTDVTTWPASSRETEVRRSASNQVEDPEAKGGIVGAFCRAFTLDEAIAEFLPDIYAPCEELGDDRYSFIAGSTSGGLIVYDHKLAYSHHNTDPAGGKLCNAFDLVRLHKFGDLDERVKEDTEVTKTPSYKAMADFAGALKEVKKEIVRERRESTANDYDTLETKARDTATNDDWVGELETEGKSGKIKSTINNVVLILNNDANLAGCFGFNEFEQRETAVKALPWDKVGTKYPRPLCDSDDAELRLYFERCYDITGKEKLADGLTVVIKANSYHPIRSYLDALEWDGVERLDTLFIRLFGADDTDYTRAITRKSFAAAVARIYQPGIKYDYIVVIIGDQGVGKSSTLKAMGGDWFSDSVTTLTGKEALESIQGAWLIELGELAGLRRAEVDAVKHFVSKTEDRYRVAYGKRIEHFPRRCVFFGTTNEEDFLRDVTGNRRFWVMNCKGRVGVTPFYDYMSKTTVAQLWAEAKERYARGEKLYLEDDLEGVARAIQDKHLEKDERSGLIREYLERKLPKNWDTLEPYSRRQWLKEEDNVGTVERGSVCILEIWTECLGKAPEDITRRDSMDIGRVMKTFRDWTPAPAARVKWYGAQKMYTKRA